MSRFRLPWAQFLAVAGLAVGLPACTEAGGYAIGATVASLIVTDKTPLDHVASMGAQDCSLVRFSQGDVWCVADDGELIAPLPAQTKYCYRTLGEVTCYAEPSPHPHDTLVGIATPRPHGLDEQ